MNFSPNGGGRPQAPLSYRPGPESNEDPGGLYGTSTMDAEPLMVKMPDGGMMDANSGTYYPPGSIAEDSIAPQAPPPPQYQQQQPPPPGAAPTNGAQATIDPHVDPYANQGAPPPQPPQQTAEAGQAPARRGMPWWGWVVIAGTVYAGYKYSTRSKGK